MRLRELTRDRCKARRYSSAVAMSTRTFRSRVCTSRAGLGGTVEERVYPGMGHTINEDEIKCVRSLLTHISVRPA
jgi:hypothetical protein